MIEKRIDREPSANSQFLLHQRIFDSKTATLFIKESLSVKHWYHNNREFRHAHVYVFHRVTKVCIYVKCGAIWITTTVLL